ncbi:MAG: HPr family phosphocarrier protein [bacterium]
MIERKVKIINKFGLHARPAALLVKTAAQFVSDISLLKDGLQVNGKSIMGVMMLAAEYGSEMTIRASGPDKEAAVEALEALIRSKFDEE